MSLSGFLEEYKFNQKWIRKDQSVKVSYSLQDTDLPEKTTSLCGDITKYYGKIKLSVSVADSIYFTTDTLTYEFMRLKSTNNSGHEYLASKVGKEKRILESIKKSLNFSFWTEPNGARSFLAISFGYDPDLRIVCEENEATGELTMIITQAMGLYENYILK